MSLPPTIAIVNPKGGVGKTTVAIHLAVAAYRSGYRNALLDADPRGSVLDWHSRTPTVYEGPPVDQVGPDRTPAAAIGQADAEMVVIDSAAGFGKRAERVLKCAGLALVPVRPSGIDLWGATDFLEVIEDYVGEGKPVAFVASQKDPRSSLSDLLIDELPLQKVPLLDGVAFRAAFARSISEGKTVLDGYDSKAAKEVQELFQNVERLLK